METNKDYREIELNGNKPSDEQWSIINGLVEGCDCESDAEVANEYRNECAYDHDGGW